MLQTSKQYSFWILIFLGTSQIFNEKSEVGMVQIFTALPRAESAYSQILSQWEYLFYNYNFLLKKCQRYIHELKEQLSLFPFLSHFRHSVCLGWTWIGWGTKLVLLCKLIKVKVASHYGPWCYCSAHPPSQLSSPLRSSTTTNSGVGTGAYCAQFIWGWKSTG